MSKIWQNQMLVLMYVASLAIVAAVVVAVVLNRPSAQDESIARMDSVQELLASIAENVKTEQSYSALPGDKRGDFLSEQAIVYSVDPRPSKSLPDTLRGACVERADEDITDVAKRIRNEVGAGEFKKFVSMHIKAKADARANCYTNFDPSGKEDIPEMMAHP